jgi:hypothetical protein
MKAVAARGRRDVGLQTGEEKPVGEHHDRVRAGMTMGGRSHRRGRSGAGRFSNGSCMCRGENTLNRPQREPAQKYTSAKMRSAGTPRRRRMAKTS